MNGSKIIPINKGKDNEIKSIYRYWNATGVATIRVNHPPKIGEAIIKYLVSFIMIKTEINRINDQNTNPSFNESFVAS